MHVGTVDSLETAREAGIAVESPYWDRARHPIASLVFLLPLLAFYEWGTLALSDGAGVFRNGADAWMRMGLEAAGFRHLLLLPVIVITSLLTWQCWGRYPWKVSVDTLAGMLSESLLFAFGLVVAGQLQDLAFQKLQLHSLSLSSEAGRVVTYVGAGVYEEVLFRLFLLPACFAVLCGLKISRTWSKLIAIAFTGILFAAAHHVGAHGEPFVLFAFTFRTLAGVFFAALFFLRGFGITVGSHAVYDLLVGIVLMPSG